MLFENLTDNQNSKLTSNLAHGAQFSKFATESIALLLSSGGKH